jgi:hypothetical protein
VNRRSASDEFFDLTGVVYFAYEITIEELTQKFKFWFEYFCGRLTAV